MGKCIIFWDGQYNSNMGKFNSIKSRILQKTGHCFIARCNCHLSHLLAAAGTKAYRKTCGFNMEEFQVDLYYFKDITQTKGILSEY